LYVSDRANHLVHRLALDDEGYVSAESPISIVLGVRVPSTLGEGEPARAFPVFSPTGLVVDPFGNLFVASRSAIRLVLVDATGVATGDSRVVTAYGRAPAATAIEGITQCITDLTLRTGVEGPASKILFLDECAGVAVAVDRVATTP
jgi:hypothetical protein